MSGPGLPLLADLLGVFCLAAAMWFVNWLAKGIISKLVRRVVLHTTATWDDVLPRCGVFTRLSHLAPALVLTSLESRFFARPQAWLEVMGVILLLIFRDALLGLVAGVQISVNRMVQVGDWIELPKYGADGDVIEVGLTTTKVRNWASSSNRRVRGRHAGMTVPGRKR